MQKNPDYQQQSGFSRALSYSFRTKQYLIFTYALRSIALHNVEHKTLGLARDAGFCDRFFDGI